jgi:hypothetical protein
MGYDVERAQQALTLGHGNVEVAAELLISGNISVEGLRQIENEVQRAEPPQTSIEALDSVFDILIQSQQHVQSLLAGGTIGVSYSRNGTMVSYTVSLEAMDRVSEARYGVDFRTFLTNGGTARYGEVRLQETNLQPIIDRFWVQKYESFNPEDRTAVDSLRTINQELALIVQVFVGCGKNLDEARRVLEAIR